MVIKWIMNTLELSCIEKECRDKYKKYDTEKGKPCANNSGRLFPRHFSYNLATVGPGRRIK